MSSHSIRREHGFLDTGRLARTHAAPGRISVTELLRETADMLRGAVEAPLRSAGLVADYRELAVLPDHLRKDVGLDI